MKKKLLLLLVFCLAAVGLTIGATADDGWDVSDIPEEYRLPISCNDTLMTVYDNRGNEWSLQHRALNPDESCYDLLTIEGSGTITEIPDEIWNYRDNVRFIIVEGCSVGDNLFTKFDNVELSAIMGRTSSEQLKIGMEAFSSSDSLRYVYIGDGVVSIGERAFRDCASLYDVFIENVDRIGEEAFRDCVSLKSIVIPDSQVLGEYAFAGCESLETAHIMSQMVEAFAFEDCSSLREVILDGVEYIEGTAFTRGCENVSITVKNVDVLRGYGTMTNVLTTESVAFFSDAITSVTFEEGVKYIAASTFVECPSLTTVNIPDTVESIGASAFGACTGLKSLTIPESVTRIDEYAFTKCSALETINLPEGLKTINDGVFSECSSLAALDIPDGVKEIGANAFSDCLSLAEMDIPNSVTVIGENAFSGCSRLKSVKLSELVAQLPAGIFYGCASLTDIELPSIVNSIGDNAFNGCVSLPNLKVSREVTRLGGGVFDDCAALSLSVYPGSYIQAYAEAYDIPYTLLDDGVDDTVNSIESVTSAKGFDPDGKPCTVVTITMTNGDVERFCVYDGKDGEDGETVVTPAFTDVPANAYYADAVAWAVANGITGGTAENTFSPDAPCTRAQVVTFLWRAMGSPEPRSAGTFTDVNASSYYAKAVRWALENGITSGTSATTFEPNAVCTRAQVVTFLMRALDGRSYGSAGFADVAASSYYADAVAWAVANGITDGTGATTFSPDTQCNRAQIVTFLYRAVA